MNEANTVPTPPELRPAGFLYRSFAGIIDLLVLAVPLAIFISFLSVAMGISNAFVDLQPREPPRAILMAFGGKFIFIGLSFFVLMSWLYFAILESSRWQATLGKRLLSLHVGDLNGNRVTFARASARFCGGRLLFHVPFVGVYYFLIDWLSIAFTRRKQAIHDIVSECLVVRETASSPQDIGGK